MLNQQFDKTRRLLKASEFKSVFDRAPFRASHSQLLILARPNIQGHARLGLVIAKKHIRLAVERNRVKRLIRESFRREHSLAPIDAIVLARKGLGELDNSAITKLLQQQWTKINKKSNQAPQ